MGSQSEARADLRYHSVFKSVAVYRVCSSTQTSGRGGAGRGWWRWWWCLAVPRPPPPLTHTLCPASQPPPPPPQPILPPHPPSPPHWPALDVLTPYRRRCRLSHHHRPGRGSTPPPPPPSLITSTCSSPILSQPSSRPRRASAPHLNAPLRFFPAPTRCLVPEQKDTEKGVKSEASAELHPDSYSPSTKLDLAAVESSPFKEKRDRGSFRRTPAASQ